MKTTDIIDALYAKLDSLDHILATAPLRRSTATVPGIDDTLTAARDRIAELRSLCREGKRAVNCHTPKIGGLILTRKPGESIQVGSSTVTIVDASRGKVTVRIQAPPEVPISRVDAAFKNLRAATAKIQALADRAAARCWACLDTGRIGGLPCPDCSPSTPSVTAATSAALVNEYTE